MPSVVLVGAQWGDEGKGKITDFMAEQADLVVRYQGGNNAGHTVIVEGQEFKLHLVPAGILHPEKVCVIGNGVVIDPEVFLGEIDYLESRGIVTSNLRLSRSAHLIMPYHRLLDELEEERRGNDKIGTTRKGVGPAYVDKTSRTGLRVGDLEDEGFFRQRLQQRIDQVNLLLERVYGRDALDHEKIVDEYLGYAKRLQPFMDDISFLVNNALDQNKKVLFEGAQGTLLDVDHGTYPYVTSSHPVAGGACTGAGVGPTRINRVVGVTKAYTTRVGEGPFPSELHDTTGEAIRERGKEFGTTTGRPRRCGWLDMVALRYAVRVNGISALAMTKLDVLDGSDTVKICSAYSYQGRILQDYPASVAVLSQCRAIYEELPGWKENSSPARRFDELPGAAQRYLRRVEELSGVEVALVAVGPSREETLVMQPVF